MRVVSIILILMIGMMLGSMVGGGASVMFSIGREQASSLFQKYSMIGAAVGLIVSVVFAFKKKER